MADAENPYHAPVVPPLSEPRITIAPDRIRIIADLTAADQVATIRLLTRILQRNIAKWPMMLMGFAIGFTVVMIGNLTHQGPGVMAIDAGVGLVVLLLIVVVSTRNVVKRQREILSRSPFLGTVLFDLGSEALDMSGEGGYQFHVPWPLVESVIETPTIICIRYNPLAGWWIPRRNIGDQQAVDAVVAFIRARNPGVICERLDAKGRLTGTSG